MSPHEERRGHPRVRAELSLKIIDRESVVITQAENISCSGLYCKVDRLIPSITKVSMTLFIPVYSKARKRTRKKINIDGAVVRSELVNQNSSSDGYYTAIFFSNLKKQDKDIISKYVNQILPDNGH